MDGQRNLLSDHTLKNLGILKIGPEVNEITDTTKLMNSPFPKIKGVQVRVHMDPKVTPVFQALRRVPLPLENAVSEKLDEKGPASWVSPLGVANKTNGTIRLCVDLR
ncbi:uncharacterized protein LOC134204640 [Armigeres subalbatus]|uniref:uncharacterized protein LOC134204640 n=1 Tax=Armigeres subalbatus TaxID=124917 RepID=UPI002ED497D4